MIKLGIFAARFFNYCSIPPPDWELLNEKELIHLMARAVEQRNYELKRDEWDGRVLFLASYNTVGAIFDWPATDKEWLDTTLFRINELAHNPYTDDEVLSFIAHFADLGLGWAAKQYLKEWQEQGSVLRDFLIRQE